MDVMADEPKVILDCSKGDIQIQNNDNSSHSDDNNDLVSSVANSDEISEIEEEIFKTEEARSKSKYWNEVVAWDEKNLRTGMDRVFEPILNSDIQYYDTGELEGFPKVILYLAKNEIYARHGYIFMDEELGNYFKGQVWYTPTVKASDFRDDVFNEYETANLRVLVDILSALE